MLCKDVVFCCLFRSPHYDDLNSREGRKSPWQPPGAKKSPYGEEERRASPYER